MGALGTPKGSIGNITESLESLLRILYEGLLRNIHTGLGAWKLRVKGPSAGLASRRVQGLGLKFLYPMIPSTGAACPVVDSEDLPCTPMFWSPNPPNL